MGLKDSVLFSKDLKMIDKVSGEVNSDLGLIVVNGQVVDRKK